MKNFSILGVHIAPGQKQVINFNLARLPSGTQIDLPVYVFRSKVEGPTLLLSAGMHGDEVNGIEIVRRLIEKKTLHKVAKGSIIAIPVMNIYGFLNFSREVPDGKDINRSFPGNATGSLAARVAHHLSREILPLIDIGLDFHTGGASRYNFPQVRFAPEDKEAAALAQSFGAPLSLSSKLIDKSLRKQAYAMGKTIVVYEGGESMRMEEDVIQHGIDGAMRAMHRLGILKTTAPRAAIDSVHCYDSTWVRARRSGLFTSVVKSGNLVMRNQTIGTITDPFGEFRTRVQAPASGFIIGHNNMPVVNQGDALFHLGFVKE